MRIKTTISATLLMLGIWICFPLTGRTADSALESMRSTVGNSKADLENYRKLLVELEKAKLKAKDQEGATAAKLEIIRLDRELAAMDGGSSRRTSRAEAAGNSAAEKTAADKASTEKIAAEKAAADKAADEKAAAEKIAAAKAAAEKVAAQKAAAEKIASEKDAADKAAAAKAAAEKVQKAAAEEAATEKALAAIVAAEKTAAKKAAAEKAATEKAAAEKAAAAKTAAEKAAAEKAAAAKAAAEKAAAEKAAAEKAATEKAAAAKAAAEKAAAEKAATEKAAAAKVAAKVAAEKATAEKAATEKAVAAKAAAEKVVTKKAAAEEAADLKAADESQKMSDLKNQLRQHIAEGNEKLSTGDVQGARETKAKISELQEELTRLSTPAGAVTQDKPAVVDNHPAPAPVLAPASTPAPTPTPAATAPTPIVTAPTAAVAPAPQPLTPILRGPQTQVSSVQGLAATQGFSRDNVYLFNLNEVGPTATLTYYATGRRSKDTSGNVWLITPSGHREKVAQWKSGQFEKTSTDVSSHTSLKPVIVDISNLVKATGSYQIEFEWIEGLAPLVIYRVEITS